MITDGGVLRGKTTFPLAKAEQAGQLDTFLTVVSALVSSVAGTCLNRAASRVLRGQ
jgi:hypothetical protein